MEILSQNNHKESSINNNKPNIITRVSIAFEKRFMLINKRREENNAPGLSRPKFTELILKHKLWNQIQEDIINYSLKSEDEDDEE